MSQGKPRKEYLLKCAKEDHKPLESYSKDKSIKILAKKCFDAFDFIDGLTIPQRNMFDKIIQTFDNNKEYDLDKAREEIIERINKYAKAQPIYCYQNKKGKLKEVMLSELEWYPEFIKEISNDKKDEREN